MIIRSIFFYVLMCLWTILLGLLCMPYLIVPSHYLNKPIKIWISGIFFLLKYVCNIVHELKGLENIPLNPILVASKHQSAFETFALFYYLPQSIFIHKRQLFFIPIFGQYLKKINMISIDRAGGVSTVRLMLKQTKIKVSQGYSIIIFPEGTRKIPGAKPNYKPGFVTVYEQIKTKILPVAVNSGKFWPKHSFIKKPGNIIIEFLPLIDSNLPRNQVLMEVQKKIEEATNKII